MDENGNLEFHVIVVTWLGESFSRMSPPLIHIYVEKATDIV